MTSPQSVIRLPQLLALFGAIGLLLCGCGAQEEILVEDSVVESVAAKPQAEIVPTGEEANPDDAPTDETESVPQPVADSFEPPFPGRVELFVAPKRRGRGAKQSADGIDNAVELLGFVNVDGQRAVLSIDGLVSPLAEGSQEAGIEVISIQPPAVVLQRGRQRWQVNLEY
ncbi:MAG: hypothetical protein GXP28_04000 [Planctomycetes bacterium]|nr:hypothetical protein [Planctomycetota bacterium]